MKEIKIINIEDFEKFTEEQFFLIFLRRETGNLEAWTKNGFHEIAKDLRDTFLWTKKEIITEYNGALRSSREMTIPDLYPGGGRLDIIGIHIDQFVV